MLNWLKKILKKLVIKGDAMYTAEDYKKAIEFALNYPPRIRLYRYNMEKDIYQVTLFDEGWYNIKLMGSFVRSCLKWKGVKRWTTEQKKSTRWELL